MSNPGQDAVSNALQHAAFQPGPVIAQSKSISSDTPSRRVVRESHRPARYMVRVRVRVLGAGGQRHSTVDMCKRLEAAQDGARCSACVLRYAST